MTFRSLLFVPGSRPERFEKALAAGADSVCIDLEDAVAPQGKDAAREAVARFIAQQTRVGLGVRINGTATSYCAADIVAIKAAEPAFVMVPKVETAHELAGIGNTMGLPLWPIIESAEGLKNAWDIAAVTGVEGVLFGGADYSADIGSTLDWDALLFARGMLVAACARAGVQLLDVPHLDIADEAGLISSTHRVKAMGFTGRSCIHPGQVAGVNGVFSPTVAEIDRAHRIMAAFEASEGGVAQLDGKLIELPVIRAARRTLERVKD